MYKRLTPSIGNARKGIPLFTVQKFSRVVKEHLFHAVWQTKGVKRAL